MRIINSFEHTLSELSQLDEMVVFAGGQFALSVGADSVLLYLTYNNPTTVPVYTIPFTAIAASVEHSISNTTVGELIRVARNIVDKYNIQPATSEMYTPYLLGRIEPYNTKKMDLSAIHNVRKLLATGQLLAVDTVYASGSKAHLSVFQHPKIFEFLCCGEYDSAQVQELETTNRTAMLEYRFPTGVVTFTISTNVKKFERNWAEIRKKLAERRQALTLKSPVTGIVDTTAAMTRLLPVYLGPL